VKTALFLVAGLVAHRAGSSRLSEVGGLVRTAPLVAVLFAVPALSLAGIPPFSGFLPKFVLVDAGMSAEAWIAVAASLAVGLLTLYSMTKIWAGVFWGVPEEEPSSPPNEGGRWSFVTMAAATGSLVVASIGVSLWAGELYDVAERSAEDLLERDGYVEVVLERAP